MFPERPRQCLGGVDVVVDQEDAPTCRVALRGRRRRRRRRNLCYRLKQCRKPNGDLRARPNAAATRGYRPAVKLNEPTADVKTNSQPALCAIKRTVSLRKQIEDARQHFGPNADAVV